MAGLRARLKSCWSIVSNIHPRAETTSTNQWYRVSSRYQGAVPALRVAAGASGSSKCIAGPPGWSVEDNTNRAWNPQATAGFLASTVLPPGAAGRYHRLDATHAPRP